jgi:DNA-binding CsgD family transcriptional regulator
MARQQTIAEYIERLVRDANFTPSEHMAWVLMEHEGLTLREVAASMNRSPSVAYKHLARARRKVAEAQRVRVAQLACDPEEWRQARRLLQCIRNESGKRVRGGCGRRPSQDPVPDWIPVRMVPRLCGVAVRTVQNWIADPRHPCKPELVEFEGREQLCVSRHSVPLLPEYTQGRVPTRAELVTPFDLVEWRVVGMS